MPDVRNVWWLSNTTPVTIKWKDEWYPSVEHFYQAMKSPNKRVRSQIHQMSWSAAKKFGAGLKRDDWPTVKLKVMEFGLRQKFSPGSDFAQKLLDSYPTELVEYCEWHDNFWGSCTCKSCGDRGQNHLGKLLMKIRDEYLTGNAQSAIL